MSYDRLDDIFRQKLKEREFSPSDAAMASMEQMLNGDKPKGTAWPWFALFGVLLVAAGYCYVQADESHPQAYVERSEKGLLSDVPELREQTKVIESFAQLDLVTKVQKSNGIVSQGTGDLNSMAPDGKDHRSFISTDKETKSTAPNQGQAASGQAQHSLQVLDETQQEIQKSSQAVVRSETIQMAKVESSIQGIVSDNSQNPQDISAESEHGTGNQRNGEPLFNKPAESADDAELTTMYSNPNRQPEVAQEIISYPLDSMLMLGTDLDLSRPQLEVASELDSLPPVLDYVKEMKSWCFGIQPYFSIVRVSKTLTADGAEWDSTVRYRERKESPIWSSSYGVDLFAKRGHIGLSTGFALIELGEDVQYKDVFSDSTVYEEFEYFEFLDTTYTVFILDSMGQFLDSIQVTEIYDTLLVTSIDSSIVSISDERSRSNGFTSLTYVEVPFALSYGFDFKRWKFEPSVGVAFGFLRGYSGNYFGSDNELTAIGTQELVLKKTILSMTYGLGIGYDLSNRFSLWAALRSRRSLDSVMEEKGIDQRYTSNSIRFGVRYTF